MRLLLLEHTVSSVPNNVCLTTLPLPRAQVLALLAFCNVEAGEAEQAMACLQALRQLGDPQAAAHFAASFLSLRILLQLGRWGGRAGPPVMGAAWDAPAVAVTGWRLRCEWGLG